MNKPTKPNITIPESFAVNGVKADFDNNKILNGFDRIQPDVLAGDNLNKFIDDTYKASNYALSLGDYVDEKVSKSGDTMTGNLSIAQDDFATFSAKSLTYDITTATAPTSNINIGRHCFRDKNDVYTGGMENWFTTSGIAETRLLVQKSISNTVKSAKVGLGIKNDGTVYFDFPKCTTKPTTTSSASNNNVAVIVQNYVNGTSWYRVYSDGWCEQGGIYTVPSSATVATISLLKSYIDTNYFVMRSNISSNTADTTNRATSISIKTPSSFDIYTSTSNVIPNIMWYACGYIA